MPLKNVRITAAISPTALQDLVGGTGIMISADVIDEIATRTGAFAHKLMTEVWGLLTRKPSHDFIVTM
jgi:hypothetical protein